MCALCPLPLLLSRHVLSFLSLVPFSCCHFLLFQVLFSSSLVCVFLPFFIFSLTFLSWTLYLCLPSFPRLSYLPLRVFPSPPFYHYYLSHDLFLFSLPLQRSVSITLSLHPCVSPPAYVWFFLEVWDSWTSLNFKASDDGGNIKVKQ